MTMIDLGISKAEICELLGCSWETIVESWSDYTEDGIEEDLDDMFPEDNRRPDSNEKYTNEELAAAIFEHLSNEIYGG